MSTITTENKDWRPQQIFLLRLAFLFFIVLSIPYDLNLFRSLSGGFFAFENWFQLATYRTSFIPESLYVGINLEGYYNWLIAFFVALLGTFIWQKSKYRRNDDYDQIYYWLRVLIRYRLALAAIFFGVVKFLPIQIPDVTISDLHTEYGDYLLWKLYYLTNGISTAGYVPVIGVLEIAGGLLLLSKRTTVIGAGILLAVFLNVVLVNFVYDIGEQVYSSFLFLLSFVLILYDLPRLYSLLVRETTSYPDTFVPLYSDKIRKIRPFLQVLFLLVISIFSVQAYSSWKDTDYPFPYEKGIEASSGIYDVRDFVLNGDTLAYSLTDSVRWQNIVFEEWNTLSVRENTKVKIDSLKPRIVFQSNKDRNYEQLGNGGRHFYRYTYTEGEEDRPATLKLFNKTDTSRFYDFTYEQRSKNEVLLRGTDWKGDSLRITLDRLPKRYLLKEGRRKPIKIY
ncbi:beta-carotene 15,15'-monooxygenase [Sphingobacterium phlebotomi]|uniref:Beta-carotene 15,15'-monooxygenase n=1 Tax=Sphingobacterium phlebotomi TaxID=2605433 RepID=A0A5D4H4X6_9SPHI|nr:DoxX family protein [Sphingobacterium phlebotomi]TYR34495.1 beta-carotene 15,15'-monooxygenase [Sphingobacterium phlebotomi]